MRENKAQRHRMIFDLPPDLQLAVRLRALKNSTTTTNVICEALQNSFRADVDEARAVIAEQRKNPRQAGHR
jgi:hypothetical protein